MSNSESPELKVTSDFNLIRLRLWVALVAHLLPLFVFLITLTITSSISYSYHTAARDVFVGLLFVIGALFWSYDGHVEEKILEQENHSPNNERQGFARLLIAKVLFKLEQILYKVPESLVSKIGGLAAIVAALYPTACKGCPTDAKSITHYVAATILFSAIVYFCLIAFRYQAKVKIKEAESDLEKAATKEGGGIEVLAERKKSAELLTKRKRRLGFYTGCGLAIAAIMIALLAAQFTLSAHTIENLRLTYIAETAALELFGFAWLIATKTLPFFTQEDERFHPFGKGPEKQKGEAVLTGA